MNIVIADTHPMTRVGVEHVLTKAFHSASVNVLHAGNVCELYQTLERTSCNLLICEYVMPGSPSDGLVLMGTIRRRYPSLSIVLFTAIDSLGLVRSAVVRLGIDCLVSKNDGPLHLVEAINAACAGHPYVSPSFAACDRDAARRAGISNPVRLTPREAEVIRLFVSGRTINEIAAILNRSKQTVSAQKRAAQIKLGAPRDMDL
ncbi:response regulator, partial [Paraburkholderia sp. RL17-373-BIF-A]|uniref:response regulator n=1 Tax=Paraburkholderia sp. RL17-373-BIF-A TaxID=3031629 RepID=UPI0038B727B8